MSTVFRIPTKSLPPSVDAPQDFSLVLGGPLFQLLRRSHLSGDALELVRRRVIFISLFAWLPLLAFSALEGQALPGRVAVPFITDFEAHVRFLIALPLLIVAELVVHQRMRFVVRQFPERNLIPELALPRFHKIIESAFRLRNSIPSWVIAFALVAILVVGASLRFINLAENPGWYSDEGTHLDIAHHLAQGRAAALRSSNAHVPF